MIIAALVSTIILAILSIFQIALALGAPIGQFAWGGQHKVLPPNLRVGSVLSIIIYFGIATCLLSKSSLYQITPQGTLLDVLVWIIFAYLVLGILMNAISRSEPERYTMTPTAIILAGCVFIIALA